MSESNLFVLNFIARKVFDKIESGEKLEDKCAKLLRTFLFPPFPVHPLSNPLTDLFGA